MATNRGEALEEATSAARETVAYLMRAVDVSTGPEHLELLREALASARATVVAAGYVLTTTVDAERRSR